MYLKHLVHYVTVRRTRWYVDIPSVQQSQTNEPAFPLQPLCISLLCHLVGTCVPRSARRSDSQYGCRVHSRQMILVVGCVSRCFSYFSACFPLSSGCVSNSYTPGSSATRNRCYICNRRGTPPHPIISSSQIVYFLLNLLQLERTLFTSK